MKYQIIGMLKFAEQDNYESGCDPDSTTSYMIDVSFTGKTPDEVIAKAADFLGIETEGVDNGVEKNACDEAGRVDFAKMECDDSSTPSKSEVASWKKGNLKLWYAVYTAHVEKVQAVTL